MSDQNGDKALSPECQFCKGVAPILAVGGSYSPAQFTVVAPPGKARKLKRYDGHPVRAMPGRAKWKDYEIELLGHVYHTEPPIPPIVNRKWLVWFQHIQRHTEDNRPLPEWTEFNGYRVLHKNGWEMVIHWWPSHDFIFTVKSFNPERDFDSLARFLKLFKPETRGAPKIKEVELVGAIRRLGTKATQAATAKEIGVSPQALRQWAARKGIHAWGEVKSQYKTTEVF